MVAGLLKLMDPTGASLAVESYLNFLHLGFLRPLSFPLASALSFIEVLLGICLCCGVARRIAAILSGALMAGYTILTLIVLILNPSLDCGCFGEAISLSHGWSFVKNLLLCVLWCVAFIPWRGFGEPKTTRWIAFGLTCTLTLLFGIHCLRSLPPIDFTEFAPGAEIGMDGEDPSFFICDSEGEYRDSLLLDGAVLVCSVYDPQDADLFSADGVLQKASQLGIRPVMVAPQILESFGPDSFSSDRRAIMTLCRSNGGYVLIVDGQIVSKWTASNPPDEEDMASFLVDNPMDIVLTNQRRTRLALEGGLGLLLILMLAL